jgi:hypothetical protein
VIEQIKEIDQDIRSLKKQLNQVEGRETEVYSRIVGYYRSVRNWNVGKKGEYKERVTFSKLTGRNITEVKQADPETRKNGPDASGYWSYTYFYRTTCPNCPPMKKALESVNLKSNSFNVDTEEGIAEAAGLNIFSAPTVVFFDKQGKELYRTGNVKDIENNFTGSAATA